MHDESHIERNARHGQTSAQLAERNSLRRLTFYGGLGAVAGVLGTNFLLPAWMTGGAFIGLILGLGLATAIDEKMKRVDAAKRAGSASDLEQERERELQARIRAAKESGDFDRWGKDS